MSEVWTDPTLARNVACALACCGVVISSLEWLVPPAKLTGNALLAWECFGESWGERLWRPLGLRIVFGVRLVCAALFLFCLTRTGTNPSTLAGSALSVAALMCLPARVKPPIGVFVAVDGAEHMFTTVLIALAPTFFFSSSLILQVALFFVALQVSLEYATAGWSKLSHWRGWVQGPYLLQVFSSSNYGHRGLAQLLQSSPTLAGMISIAIILLEIAAPLALLLPAPLAEVLLLGLLAFHIATAVCMGLNTYVWAFAAAYPAVLYCRNVLLSM
jgi:hypothetical protein